MRTQEYKFQVYGLNSSLPLKYYLRKIGISSTIIKDLRKEYGLVKLNNKITTVNELVKNNDKILLTIKEAFVNNVIPSKNKLDIAYEDDYIIIVYKPHGLDTIPTRHNNENTLANYVTYYANEKNENFIFRCLNRLDKETEGYIIVAKDRLIYSLLTSNKSLHKVYTAVCKGKIQTMEISSHIETLKDEYGKNVMKRIVSSNGKSCLTKITNSKYNTEENISVLNIELQTGRTHQIRVHLSSLNHPIIGDKIYNDVEDNIKNIPLQLYCNEIFIWHPILNKTIHLFQNIKIEYK